MPNVQKANLLHGKDLITIGIFSAIYFVLNFICLLVSGLRLPCGCEVHLAKGGSPYERT